MCDTNLVFGGVKEKAHINKILARKACIPQYSPLPHTPTVITFDPRSPRFHHKSPYDPRSSSIQRTTIRTSFHSPNHTFLRLDLEAYDICRFLTFLVCVIALP